MKRTSTVCPKACGKTLTGTKFHQDAHIAKCKGAKVAGRLGRPVAPDKVPKVPAELFKCRWGCDYQDHEYNSKGHEKSCPRRRPAVKPPPAAHSGRASFCRHHT